MIIKNEDFEASLISQSEYNSSFESIKLFEDRRPFSFGKVILGPTSLKFAWNSKNIIPSFKFLKNQYLVFIGVDTFIRGFNCKTLTVDFSLNTDTFFKWFDEIPNGLAIIAETEVIMINTNDRCSLRKIAFYKDIIMGTKVENEKMIVAFIDEKDKIISTY